MVANEIPIALQREHAILRRFIAREQDLSCDFFHDEERGVSCARVRSPVSILLVDFFYRESPFERLSESRE